jgi:hypothetical protein
MFENQSASLVQEGIVESVSKSKMSVGGKWFWLWFWVLHNRIGRIRMYDLRVPFSTAQA